MDTDDGPAGPPPGLTRALARYVSRTRYTDLPGRVVAGVKASLLDAVGVTLAASTLSPECRPFAEMARNTGLAEATVLGFGHRTSAAAAAFANGAMSHALDFEDAHESAPVHPNAATAAAALAVAEREGASGPRLITALAVGCDLASRLGLAVGTRLADAGWYPPPLLSVHGAVAAAASLLSLGEQATADAFALAMCQVACTFEIVNGDRSVLRSVREAFSARAAVDAADLAAGGVAGGPVPFEGPHGFFASYSGGQLDVGPLLDGLGERFETDHISYKMWPSCRGTHPFVEGALRIRSRWGLRAADVRGVRLTGGPIARMLTEPPERKARPRTAIDAKFSLPFTVATALAHGDVTLDSFAGERLDDEAILAMARLVRCEIDQGQPDNTARVVVETTDGQVHSEFVTGVAGDPGRPLDSGTLEGKFRNCAARATAPLPAGRIDQLVAAIGALERVTDINRELSPLLTPAGESPAVSRAGQAQGKPWPESGGT
ncbi:MAG TPA: MmgE/PrpD family protein [Streptosporangiaceae bacterium]|nr:MmgE/PrpD family protein [Streptosporangiaceae bacterium]